MARAALIQIINIKLSMSRVLPIRTASAMTISPAQIAKYPAMLLTVKGRKTGKLRTIPLIYIRDADRFVIAAAYAGSEQNPTWWLNLQSRNSW